MIEVKIIVKIIIMGYIGIEIHKDIHITLLIKSGRKNGTKGI